MTYVIDVAPTVLEAAGLLEGAVVSDVFSELAHIVRDRRTRIDREVNQDIRAQCLTELHPPAEPRLLAAGDPLAGAIETTTVDAAVAAEGLTVRHRLPGDLDYSAVGGLSNEIRDKLTTVRPLTLGQAARTLMAGEDPARLLLK